MGDLKKIVVIGPESSGKSTLCEALARHLGTVWVPEFARGYLENLGRPYKESDLLVMAEGQLQSETRAAAQAGRYLICDTDLYIIKVWSEHRYHRCSVRILEQLAERSCDLYLLTLPDLRWTEDPLREFPEEHMRSYFFHQYKDIVLNERPPWALIAGTAAQRLTAALQAIRQYLPPEDRIPFLPAPDLT